MSNVVRAGKALGKLSAKIYKESDKALFKKRQNKIKALNKKLTGIQKVVDEDTYKDILSSLNLPSSDFVTKSGKISTSKKLWDSVDSKELKSIIAKSDDFMDIKQLRAEAKGTLEKTGFIELLKEPYESDKAFLQELHEKGEVDDEFEKEFGKYLKRELNKKIREAVDLEVKSKFKVEKNIDEAIQDWYDFILGYGSILASEYPEIIDLDKFIYSEGLKSYTELYSWMQDAEDVINKALH